MQKRLVDEAAGDRRLVGDHHGGEAGALQQAKRIAGPREDIEQLEAIEIAALLDDRAVAIEETTAGRSEGPALSPDRAINSRTFANTRSGDRPFMHR